MVPLSLQVLRGPGLHTHCWGYQCTCCILVNRFGCRHHLLRFACCCRCTHCMFHLYFPTGRWLVVPWGINASTLGWAAVPFRINTAILNWKCMGGWSFSDFLFAALPSSAPWAWTALLLAPCHQGISCLEGRQRCLEGVWITHSPCPGLLSSSPHWLWCDPDVPGVPLPPCQCSWPPGVSISCTCLGVHPAEPSSP